MKYKIVLFVILFPVFVRAQTAARIDTLVNQLIDGLRMSWTMGIDNNSRSVDLKAYNKFKTLFATDATIDDDFNFRFIPGKKAGTYAVDIKSKPFDLYAHDVALEISKLRIDNDTILYKNPDSLIVEIRRTVWAEKPRKYLFQDTDSLVNSILSFHKDVEFEKNSGKERDDEYAAMKKNLKGKILRNPDSVYQFRTSSTLRIHMIMIKDSVDSKVDVKIKTIETILKNATVECLNDDDKDGILNGEDSCRIANNCKNPYGDFTANGMPDYDLDGVPDATDKCPVTYTSKAGNQGCPTSFFINQSQIEGFIGAQLNSADINLPELNQLGYVDQSGNNATDVLQSEKGILKNPGSKPGISVGGNYIFYFGTRRRNTGVSIGFTYSAFKADYQLEAPMIYTFKSSDGTNNYRRQVSIISLNEEISYHIINLPVMFDFRFKPGIKAKQKLVINLKAGPSVMIFRNSSDYNANIDLGGLYQVDTIRQDAITYYDHFDAGSRWNVLITPQSINTQNPNPGAGTVFSRLYAASANYDFASNKNYRDTKKLSRTTVAINLGCDIQYNISRFHENGMAVKLGAYFVYAPLPERKQKYIPLDRTSDEFNSIYNSTAKSNYSTFGIIAGFVYSF